MFDHGSVHKSPGNCVFLDHSNTASGIQEGSKVEILEGIEKAYTTTMNLYTYAFIYSFRHTTTSPHSASQEEAYDIRSLTY